MTKSSLTMKQLGNGNTDRKRKGPQGTPEYNEYETVNVGMPRLLEEYMDKSYAVSSAPLLAIWDRNQHSLWV